MVVVIFFRYRSGNILIVSLHKKIQILQKLKGHDDEVQGLCWSPLPGDHLLMRNRDSEENDMPEAQDQG